MHNGVLELSGIPFGDYDQCLSIESPEEVGKPKIIGQYCGIPLEPFLSTDEKGFSPEMVEMFQKDNLFVTMLKQMFSNMFRTLKKKNFDDWMTSVNFVDSSIVKSMKFFNGLCLPSTCSPKEVANAVNQSRNLAFAHLNFNNINLLISVLDSCLPNYSTSDAFR